MIINNDLIPIIVDDIIAYARRLQLYPRGWTVSQDYGGLASITITMLAPHRLMVTGIDSAEIDTTTPGNVYYLPMGTEVRYRTPDTLLSSYCRDVGLQVARTEIECDSSNDVALTVQLIVTTAALAIADARRIAMTTIDLLEEELNNPLI